MSRRRRRASGDSLELLLDTICNTFGGIVFIAMLVAILVRETGATREAPEAVTVAAAELVDLSTTADTLIAEVADLRARRAAARAAADVLAPEELAGLIATRDQLESASGELADRRAARAKEQGARSAALAGQEEEIAAWEDLAATAARRRAAAEATRDAAARQLAEARRESEEELRLTTVGRSDRRQVTVLIDDDRAYIAHEIVGAQAGFNFDSDEVTHLGGMIVPAPGGGTALDARGTAAVARRLGALSPDRYDVAAFVQRDSFDRWPALRDSLVAAGFRYRLVPMTPADVVTTGGGGSSGVQ